MQARRGHDVTAVAPDVQAGADFAGAVGDFPAGVLEKDVPPAAPCLAFDGLRQRPVNGQKITKGNVAGRDVVILPDNDEAGEGYARDVANILTRLAPPARVRVVRLPGLKVKENIVDWVAADGPMGDRSTSEIKAAILELVAKAPLWTPEQVGDKAPAKSRKAAPAADALRNEPESFIGIDESRVVS